MEIEIFEGQQIRTELVDGKLWFNVPDVCRILELSNPSMAVKGVRESYLKKIEVATQYGVKASNFISDRGIIRLIQRSHSSKAAPFQDWADERIEQLLLGKTVNAAGEVPKSFAQRALEFQQEAMEIISQQEQELEVTRPKARTYDRILTPDHTFGFLQLVGAVREHFPVNGNDLKRLLREQGLLYLSSLTATAKAIDGGWAVQRAQGKYGGKERFQVRFTTKTLEWLLEELAPLADAV